ncbi:MAG: hypothetical protein GX996_03055 [Firmicutes bacterium]|nr:hypothetical protein [Bacillota bacterium]
MLSNEYALISLFAFVTKIIGRKKLQKMVYLLQQAGVPYNLKFRYHHYGPYSAELQAEIDRLIGHQLLTETYDGVAYTYEITEQGRSFLQKYKEVIGHFFDLPIPAVEKLMETDTSVLEMASTYAYLLEMGYQQQDAINKTEELKPLLKNHLEEAENLLHSINDCLPQNS